MSHSAVSLALSDFNDLAETANSMLMFKNRMRAPTAGEHSSRLRGRGMIFEEVRAYSPGDDVRHIDWRVTARTNAVHTKIYSEERERAVFFCVDLRAPMQFATRGAFKSVVAARLATILAMIASKNGDRIGALAIAGNHLALKSSRGMSAPLKFYRYLCQQHQFACQERAVVDIKDALRQLYNIAKPGSMVFFLSDFADINADNKKLLVDLTRRTELTLIHIFDPIEAALPANTKLRFKDQHGQVLIDTHSKKELAAYRHKFTERLMRLEQFARRHQIHFASTSTHQEPIQQLRSQLDIAKV